METNGKPMNYISIALAFDYLEEVNYALVQSKMNICNWCIIENNSEVDMDNLQLEISGEYVEKYLSMSFRLDAKQRIRIQDIKLQVNTDKLLSLTEKVTSILTLKIKSMEGTIKEQVFPISFMAYNQWHGTDCYPQLLASFITPNHPCIASIVKRASEHLFKLCGSSDFSGYISGDEKYVFYQIEAIYQALCEEGFSYVLDMPSYETRGQRIRLANEVMANKLGNCMDLTLLFASCLEFIGLNTLLVMELGHIYLGVWLIPDSHFRSVDDDKSFLLKKTAEGVEDILLIESTSFAKAEAVPFESAIETALASEQEGVHPLIGNQPFNGGDQFFSQLIAFMDRAVTEKTAGVLSHIQFSKVNDVLLIINYLSLKVNISAYGSYNNLLLFSVKCMYKGKGVI